MSEEIFQAINEALTQIENQEDVRICLAVESGSRAWGFASLDSDYDVRFIYAHRLDWYLSINLEGRPDTLERTLPGNLDLVGWDIRKALKLFSKSNPPLLEWLQSPITYREFGSIAKELRTMQPEAYSPRACYCHYLHMAQGNLRAYLLGEPVWRKKYLYALRPLLAMRWIEQDRGPVPIEFERLIKATIDDPSLRQAIDDLVNEKRAGNELDRGPRVPELSGFIEQEMKRAEQILGTIPKRTPSTIDLDALFRRILKEVWGS